MTTSRVEDYDPVKAKKAQTKRAQWYVKIIDFLGYSGFFGFSMEAFYFLMDRTGSLLLMGLNLLLALPGSVFLSITQAGIALHEAHLKHWRAHPTIRFAIAAASALAITGVVAGLFIADAVLVAAPFVFGAVLATKAAYHLGDTFYYLHKAFVSEDEKGKSLIKAGQSFLTAVSYGLIAGGMLAFIGALAGSGAGFVAMSLAIGGGVLGACVGASKLIQSYRKKPHEVNDQVSVVKRGSSNQLISQSLGRDVNNEVRKERVMEEEHPQVSLPVESVRQVSSVVEKDADLNQPACFGPRY